MAFKYFFTLVLQVINVQILASCLCLYLCLSLCLLSALAIGQEPEIQLAAIESNGSPPVTRQALYINFWAASSSTYQKKLLNKIKGSQINALVIDVKNEFGELSYVSKNSIAINIGANQNAYVKNAAHHLKPYKDRGLYLIARLSVFKDQLLAKHYPQWAIKTSETKVYQDRRGLSWTDPYQFPVQEYNIAIAVEAAQMGFDEIHFDYSRFPSVNGLLYAQKNNRANRVAAINSFLKGAGHKLKTENVKTSVATFGYSCWNEGDTYIGHNIKALAKQVDYISPMLYPSSFHLGIPNYTYAVAYPYEVVLLSLKRCVQTSGVSSRRFRPWLQAFKDYGFDRRPFSARHIFEQVFAATEFNGNGWMLWNPGSHYEKTYIPKTE